MKKQPQPNNGTRDEILFHSRNYRVKEGFVTTKPSKTVPDQTITVKEMLQRALNGIPQKPNPYNPVYNPAITFNSANELDLTEIAELRQQLKDRENALRQRVLEERTPKPDTPNLAKDIAKELGSIINAKASNPTE